MSIRNPIEILNQGKSYVSQVSSYIRHPTKLLSNTSLGFLSNTTLSKMQGRGDPLFTTFWTIQLPSVPVAEEVNSNLLTTFSESLSSAAGTLSGWNTGLMGNISSAIMGDSASEIIGSASSALSKAGQVIGDAGKTIASSSQTLTLGDEYVESISLVNREYGSREVFRAGQNYKYPDTTVSIPDITMTLYGDRNIKSFRYIQNWINLIQGPASSKINHGGWVVPAKYKKVITVGIVDENASEFYLVDYIGCWPKSINEISLVSDGDDYIKYEASISVDDLKVYGYDLMSFTDQVINYGKAVGTDLAGDVIDQIQDWAQTGTNKILTGII